MQNVLASVHIKSVDKIIYNVFDIYFAALLKLPIIPLDALRIFVIQPKPVLLLFWRKTV